MSKRVLIVEDEAVLREVLAELLKSCGYAVEQTADAEDGCRRVGEGLPEIFLRSCGEP